MLGYYNYKMGGKSTKLNYKELIVKETLNHQRNHNCLILTIIASILIKHLIENETEEIEKIVINSEWSEIVEMRNYHLQIDPAYA